MAQTICYEVFPTSKNIARMRKVLENHGFKERQNRYGSFFYTETPSSHSWQTKYLLKIRGYKYRSYDKRYSRGTKYRQTFFDAYKGPYHCAYCGKNLTGKYFEVDHLIPVAKAKTNHNVRLWLQLCGIKNVNEAKNLVSACPKCNKKKSDRMGFWVIKGFLGRNKSFWIARNVFISVCVAITLYAVCINFPVLDLVQKIFHT